MTSITVTRTHDLPALITAPRRTMMQVERDIEREVAHETMVLVVQHFDSLFRNQSGYYLSQVHVDGAAGDMVVTDGGVVYGPWLEGEGSRNSPVTRFKGYRAYRRAKQLMVRRSVQIGDRVVRRYAG